MSRNALPAAVDRPRAFVGLSGPEAAPFLERMVSNDVLSLEVGEPREALLLTPKSRIIAPLVVLRRAEDDFLLIVDPGLGEAVLSTLVRARFAAKVSIEAEEHASYVWLGQAPSAEDGVWVLPTDAYGVAGFEVVGRRVPADAAVIGDREAELMRIEAGTPVVGAEIDDRVLPAEVGLVERAVSFTKGCYPGQEPIARLHHRGHANRNLRVIEIATDSPPSAESDVVLEGKPVGRVTSAASRGDDTVALAYVRVEVPADADLVVDGSSARLIERRRP